MRFFDPAKLGFPPSRPGETTVVARGGLATVPVAFAWLVHQVRATDDSAGMRSRLVVNHFAMLLRPARRGLHSRTRRHARAVAVQLTR